MQTDKEADPSVLRGFEEDYELAGQVSGVDLIVGGHSDNGLEEPVCHPVTGVCVVMTYGQGMHLGEVIFQLSTEEAPKLVSGRLIPVDAGRLQPDAEVQNLIAAARQAHPDLQKVVTRFDRRAARRYYRESEIGNLLADSIRTYAGAQIGLIPAGAIRADFEAGEVTREEVLNVFPFTDRISILEITGEVLRQVLEKSLSLEYGLAQFSGIKLEYDGSRPIGRRLVHVTVGGTALDLEARYSLVTGSFTATGGENYRMFDGLPLTITDTLLSDALMKVFAAQDEIQVPRPGRQVDLAKAGK